MMKILLMLVLFVGVAGAQDSIRVSQEFIEDTLIYQYEPPQWQIPPPKVDWHWRWSYEETIDSSGYFVSDTLGPFRWIKTHEFKIFRDVEIGLREDGVVVWRKKE